MNLGYFIVDEVLRLEVTRIYLEEGHILFEAQTPGGGQLQRGDLQFVLYGPDHQVILRNRMDLDVGPTILEDTITLTYRARVVSMIDDRWEQPA